MPVTTVTGELKILQQGPNDGSSGKLALRVLLDSDYDPDKPIGWIESSDGTHVFEIYPEGQQFATGVSYVGGVIVGATGEGGSGRAQLMAEGLTLDSSANLGFASSSDAGVSPDVAFRRHSTGDGIDLGNGSSGDASKKLYAANIGTGAALASDTDGTLAANSDSRVATQKATKAYADTKIASSALDTDGTLAANSDAKVASQKAIKTYVDTIAAGLKWKVPVRVATTAAGTLASSFANGSTVDGVSLVTGDRILIKDQASGSENGLYVVAASGAPTRATDADSGTELVSAAVFVMSGTSNADKAFVCTNDSITLGSTTVTFVGFASVVGALIAANNLSDLASASTARTNLGLGTLATQSGTFSGTSSGTNTGDQDLSGLAPKASPSFTGDITDTTGGLVLSHATGGTIKERARTTALGEWLSVTFAAGNFTASPGTWTVSSGQQTTYAYTLIGKTMILAFCIDGGTTASSPGHLDILIPGGFSAARDIEGTFAYSDDAGATGKIGNSLVSGTKVLLYKDITHSVAWGNAAVYVRGQISFQIS